MLSTTFRDLAVALGLGLLVGLQKERTESPLAGLRTFAIVTWAGADIKYFPAGIQLTGIDLSPRMLDLVRPRLSECPSPVELLETDVTRLELEDEVFIPSRTRARSTRSWIRWRG